jgi:hypothetical protein
MKLYSRLKEKSRLSSIRESHYAGYDAPGRNTYRIM